MSVNALSGHAPDGGRYRLLIRSIGTADAAVIPVMRRLRPAPDVELAGLLYRAPAELIGGLDAATGTRLRDLLRETGIEGDLRPVSEPFEPGVGTLEVALAVRRFDRMPALVEQPARELGLAPDAAVRLVTTMPAVLLGRVSAATADALRRRFAPLGAEIDVSDPAAATFDVAVETSEPQGRRLVAELLGESPRGRVGDADRFMATGLDAAGATRLWERLSRTPARVRVLNRDLQRFDVRLEHAPSTPEVRAWLRAVTGMPDHVADAAAARTPFLLAENVSGATMAELLDGARARGARATGILLALQFFALELGPGGDRAAPRAWVEIVAGRDAAAAVGRAGARRLDGPFTKTQARWLQHVLRGAGVPAHLVER